MKKCSSKKIILVGGGGHCQSVIDVIEQDKRFDIAGIIDNKIPVGSKVSGYEVLGDDSILPSLIDKAKNAFVTVGQIHSAEIRVSIFLYLKKLGYSLPIIISPRAYVSKNAKVSQGSIVMHDALINSGANIGENCIINSKALIEHGVIIGNHCHISTGAILNGEVVIGKETFVGSNATIVASKVLEAASFVKASSLIK